MDTCLGSDGSRLLEVARADVALDGRGGRTGVPALVREPKVVGHLVHVQSPLFRSAETELGEETGVTAARDPLTAGVL